MPDSFGDTALMMAMVNVESENDPKSIKAMSEQQCCYPRLEINKQNRNALTALHYMCAETTKSYYASALILLSDAICNVSLFAMKRNSLPHNSLRLGPIRI